MENPLRHTNIKIMSAKKLLTLVSLILALMNSLPSVAEGAGASLYLSPASGTFFVGSTFDISVFVNTGGEDVNAVEVNLKFDPTKIQVASPTTGKSFIKVWVAQPTYSNTKGTMTFIGGIPTPGINTSSGLVSTVTFRAISPGETSVVFLDSCKVLRNDPDGTDILTSMGRGVYTLLIPPPEGPKVFSPTHPDQNKWYKNNNPTFSWEKEEGITDFSFNFDQDSSGVPDNVSEGDYTSVSFSNVEDGIWYFHVKAKKAGVWGGTSHFGVRIDSTSPAIFTPTVEPSTKITEKQPLISFITTDAFSGIDYYTLKYIDITPEREEEVSGFFTEVSSPYKLPALETGKYVVVVRAYDWAGNWREGTVKIEIFPKGLFFTKKGIQFQEIFIPWWMIIAALLLIILLIILYSWKKQRDLTRREREEVRGIGDRFDDERERRLIGRVRREAREEVGRQRELLRRMETERKELESELHEVSENKKALELEKAQLSGKKAQIEKELAGIQKKESQIEQEGKMMEEREKAIRLPAEKQKIERMRWELEDKRRETETARWRLEEENNEIESQIEEINSKYQEVLEKENNLKQKIEEINSTLESQSQDSEL